MSVEELKSHLQYLNKVNLSNPSLELGCIHSLGLLLEHIQPYITLDTVIEHNEKYPQFFKMDIITILYQLYFTLFFLSKKFTHYDLHLGNVLLYKPSKNGYINFIYHHQNNEVTSFKSQYVVKIIDYGRCFFQDENISSYSIYKKLCEIKKCDPDCGDNYGFGWLNSESTASNYFVNSQKINVSHDLRYLYELNRKLKKYGITNIDPSLKKILSSVLYGVDILKEKNKRFGTKEINESNQSEYEKLYPHKIKNVMEAKEEIQKYVFCDMTHFKKLKKIGDLHIFDNGENMRYIPY